MKQQRQNLSKRIQFNLPSAYTENLAKWKWFDDINFLYISLHLLLKLSYTKTDRDSINKIINTAD